MDVLLTVVPGVPAVRVDHRDLALPVQPHLSPLPAAGSRVPSIDDVLQDGSPQHHGCSQPVPPADIYLPGNGTKSRIDIWAEPTSVSEGRGRKGESRVRPSVPLQSPGHLSDSKLYSANPAARLRPGLVCLLPSCSPRVISHPELGLRKAGQAVCQNTKSFLWLLPVEAQGGQSCSAEAAVCLPLWPMPVAYLGHCPGVQQLIPARPEHWTCGGLLVGPQAVG